MTRKIKDPDFGEIEVPEPPTDEQFQARAEGVKAAISAQRLWPKGSVTKCPECGKKAMVGRDDLSTKVVKPGAILVFRWLRGGKCGNCGLQLIEPGDIVAVEAEAGVGMIADFEAKVSRIGSGSLGTYWPKDVVRVMGLEPDKKAFIQVIDPETALVSFQDPATEARRQAKRRPDG